MTTFASTQNARVQSAAASASGQQALTWPLRDASNNDIAMGVTGSSSVPFPTPAPLSAAGAASDGEQVAVDANGDAFFVWNYGAGDIQGRWHLANAAAYSPVVDLSPGATGNGNPQLAMDSKGDVAVVWQRGDISQVVYAALNGPFSAPQDLIAPSATAGVGDPPVVAMNPRGDALIAFTHDEGGHKVLRVASRAAGAAGGFGPAGGTLISDPAQNALGPQVALNNAGEAVVVWYRDGGSGFTVAQASRPTATSPFAAPVDLSDQNASDPAVALNGSGRAIVTWIESTNLANPPEILQASERPPGAASFGAPFTVSPPGGQMNWSPGPEDPHVALDDAGDATFLFMFIPGWPTSHTNVIESVQRPVGGSLDAQQRSPAGQDADTSALAVDPHGNVLAAWARQTDNPMASNYLIQYQRYTAPAAPPPIVTTGASSNITRTTAMAAGTIDARGLDGTSYHFEYGTSAAYGTSTTVTRLPSGSGAQVVNAALTGLAPATTYHIRLVATGPGGTSYGTDSSFTTGAAGPAASFKILTPKPRVGSPVVFEAPSAPGDGKITQVHWNFGDGTAITLAGLALTRATTSIGGVPEIGGDHTYSIGGTHTITMTVLDANGQVSNAKQSIVVLGNLHVMITKLSPAKPREGQTVTFSAAGSSAPGAKIVAYLWRFTPAAGHAKSPGKLKPDAVETAGKFGGAPSPEVTWKFPKQGAYTASVEIVSSDGARADGSLSVSISQAHFYPIVVFTHAPWVGIAGQPVTFDTKGSHSDPRGNAASALSGGNLSIPGNKPPPTGPVAGKQNSLTGHIAWGDGDTTPVTAGKAYKHVYKTPGFREAELVLHDTEGTVKTLSPINVVGGCQSTANIRGLTLHSACLRQQGCQGSHQCFVTNPGVPADLNGVELTPAGGAHVAADTTSGALGSDADSAGFPAIPGQHLSADFGPFNLNPNFSTTIPGGGGDRTIAELPALGNVSLFGFPVSGGLPITFHTNGTATVPLFVSLPAPLDAISGSLNLASQPGGGVALDHLHIDAGPVLIGPLNIGASLDYDKPSGLWQGQFLVETGGPSVGGDAAFTDQGKFQHAHIFGDNLDIPVGPAIVQHIGIDFGVDPTRFGGDVGATFGPQENVGLGPSALADVTGKVEATFPSDGPWSIVAGGTGHIIGIPLGPAGLTYTSDGVISANGSFSYDFMGLGLFSVGGDIRVTYAHGLFNGDAGVNACADVIGCADGEIVISSIGAGVCVHGGTWLPDVGGWVTWGGDINLYWHACDLGPIQVQVAADAAGGGRTFTLPKGLKATMLGFVGLGGKQPSVELVSPSGKHYAPGPDGKLRDNQNHVLIFGSPREKLARAILGTPEPGVWHVNPLPGSVPVASVERADELAPPVIKASVSGSGLNRQLHYSIDAPGSTVTFFEQGSGAPTGPPGAFGLVGKAHGAPGSATVAMVGAVAAAHRHHRPTTGTVPFMSAPGAAGRRTIYALVEQNGVVRKEIKVGTYTAPSARSLAAPVVRVARSHGQLRVKIGSVPGATSYQFKLRARDGRRELITVGPRSRTVTIKPFPLMDSATISVTAERGVGRTGHTRIVRVAAGGIHPPGHRRHHRHTH